MNHTHYGVHICAVAVDLSTFGVNEFGDSFYIFLKQPQGIGVGYHNPSRVFVHDFVDGLE